MQLPSALSGLISYIFFLLLYFLKKKTFLIFRKRNFLITQERYIHNPGTFRTRSIFRNWGIFKTLSNIYDGTSWKNTYLVHFYAQARKIKTNTPRKKSLIFKEMELSDSKIKKFVIFSQKKAFLYFWKWKPVHFKPKLGK